MHLLGIDKLITYCLFSDSFFLVSKHISVIRQHVFNVEMFYFERRIVKDNFYNLKTTQGNCTPNIYCIGILSISSILLGST